MRVSVGVYLVGWMEKGSLVGVMGNEYAGEHCENAGGRNSYPKAHLLNSGSALTRPSCNSMQVEARCSARATGSCMEWSL